MMKPRIVDRSVTQPWYHTSPEAKYWTSASQTNEGELT